MKTKSLLLSICLIAFGSLTLKAQTDMTDQIVNPSFEENVDDMAIGWSYEGGCDTYAWHVINTDGDDTKDGNNICGLWNPTFGDVAISQQITGLENGEYKVSATMMCAANGSSSRLTTQRIFANSSSVLYGFEDNYSAETIDVLTKTLEETITFAENEVSTTAENGPFLLCEVVTTVTDGTLTLGVKTNGSDSEYDFTFPHLTEGDGWGWFKVDNFTLTQLSTGTGVNESLSPKDFTVKVNNGLIYVNGAETFKVYDVRGNILPSNQQLKSGVYVVKANASVKKIFVK